MLRLCLCLLFALTSATVAAREVKMSSPNSGACPDADSSADGVEVAVPAARATAPRETKITPSVHSDVPNRLGSPRWHSFLPGMFR